MIQEKLKNLSLQLLQSNNTEEEINAARNLADFFEQHSPFKMSKDEDSPEIALQGGMALSTYHAAFCIQESIRTARLIKGVYKAILELQNRFPGQQLHILYAGSGPYATLLFPLLPLFEAGMFQSTILEINPVSLKNAQEWAKILEFSQDLHFLEADAIRYESPQKFHLLISETMFNALLREPQLRIVANLAPQLHENGLMVPEEIRLDVYYTALAKEPYFQNLEDSSNGNASIAEYAGPLFSLTKDHNFSTQVDKGNFRFTSDAFDFPQHLASEKPDICIFTHIRTFGGHVIDLGESCLTNPHCVSNYYVLNGQPFRLKHDFEDIPKWEIELQ